jgi:hypothetical protein
VLKGLNEWMVMTFDKKKFLWFCFIADEDKGQFGE